MNLLNRVKDSYLWLKASNQQSKENLIKEANARNISTDRLIFAEDISFDDHLARHHKANLFLDTFNYNAGSTAVVCLKGGLPLLTLKGKSYHSRMSASLLKSIGLDELITTTKAEYEDKAFDLATNPNKLNKTKDKLKKIIEHEKMFNSDIFTGELEKLYQNLIIR